MLVRGVRVGIQGSSVRGGKAVVLALWRDQVGGASPQVQPWAADTWNAVRAEDGSWEVPRGQATFPSSEPSQGWRVLSEGEWAGAMVDNDAGFRRGKGVGKLVVVGERRRVGWRREKVGGWVSRGRVKQGVAGGEVG